MTVVPLLQKLNDSRPTYMLALLQKLKESRSIRDEAKVRLHASLSNQPFMLDDELYAFSLLLSARQHGIRIIAHVICPF